MATQRGELTGAWGRWGAARPAAQRHSVIAFLVHAHVTRGQAETVKSIGKFFGAASGDHPHSEVTTDNAGEAAATILTAPAAHTGHIYTLTSPLFTYNEVRAWVLWSGTSHCSSPGAWRWEHRPLLSMTDAVATGS